MAGLGPCGGGVSNSNPLMGEGGGNTADRPYEERQRFPGDYEAEVGQGPITIHALEHLGAADRGVTMFRKLLRDGIRAVQRGEDPKGVIREDGKVVNCYGGNTMVYLPPAATPEEDKKLLQETGRRVAEGYLKNPPHVNGYAK